MAESRFNPEPTPTVQVGKHVYADHNAAPKCSACGGWGPVDVTSRTCRACWRVESAVTRILERWLGAPGERFVDGTKPPYVKPAKGGAT